MKNKRGYTLVEVLVALALFSVVALPAGRFFLTLTASQTPAQLFWASEIAQTEMEAYLASEEFQPVQKTVDFNGRHWQVDIAATGEGTLKTVKLDVSRVGKSWIHLEVKKYVPAPAK